MKKIGIILSCNGLGDILSSVPIIKFLYKYYKYKINVFTYNKDIFKNYPYIISYDYSEYKKYEEELELHSTFQVGKNVHARLDIRQLHANEFGIQLLPEEMEIEYYPDEYKQIDGLPNKYIVIHPVKTWPSRTWNPDRWQELVYLLNNDGFNVVSIGKDSSEIGTYNTQKPVFDINIKMGLNLINKIDINQTWHVINKSDMVITMDSGILHLAGSTDTHILQLGSSINPLYRKPYRNGNQDYKYSYIMGKCDKFCASNCHYYMKYNNSIKKIPPVPFCLDKPETIGKKDNLDVSIYECHPNVNDVFKEIKYIHKYNK